MKAIIENKMYDTEKSEKIFNYLKNKAKPFCAFGEKYWRNCWRETDLYKTKNGNYFIHIKQEQGSAIDNEKEIIEVISEEQAKDIVSRLDPDKFIELFGEVEEG